MSTATVSQYARPPRPKAQKTGTKRPLRTSGEKYITLRGPRLSDEQKEATRREKHQRHLTSQRQVGKSIRDVADIKFDVINWERRLACQYSLKLFCETYMKAVFRLGWSEAHLKCIRKMETVYLEGGKFALAMPRGHGKSSLCQASIIWGGAYAHRRFPYFIGSTDDKATQTLKSIKTYWYGSPELYEDFPELAHPIRMTENRFHLTKSQIYRGFPTYLDWGMEAIKYPVCTLSKEDAEIYLKHCPEFLIGLTFDLHVCEIESKECEHYITRSAGANIKTAGIGGSIRGDAIIHPITLAQDRPDLVLLDDIQKDQKAESPDSCAKTVALVDGAIAGLSGPDEQLSVMMPCTVIRELDVSDTYLTRELKPEYNGERCALVDRWPDGITNTEMSLDTDEGKLWNEYNEVRKNSLRLYGNIKLATEFYEKNQKVMDRNFEISWKERFRKKMGEVSAQQCAMNIRFEIPLTFISEYQNLGRSDRGDISHIITARQLMEKTVENAREFHIPGETRHLTAFIDIQDELLFYGVYAAAPDFTGLFTHYGTWPKVNPTYFLKYQAQGWGCLSREFFARYPEQKNEVWKNSAGKMKAPLEAKIYHALGMCVNHLVRLNFIKDDGHDTVMSIQRIGIDTKWGQANDVIKRFCRECGRIEVMAYQGVGITPTNKQYEEYTRTKGWLFEDQVNPQVKEVKWVYKPDESGQYMLSCDVSRMKTFLHARLASPMGTPGSIAMYAAPPEHHEMFARHVCDSEYPEPVTARGLTKEMWLERESKPDNEYLDISVGCLALASYQGAYLKTDMPIGTLRPRRRLSSMYSDKRQTKE